MIFKPSEKERALIYLDKCFQKNRFVDIKLISKKKTLSQNNYIWLIFTSVGQDTGNTADDIYRHCLALFPTYKTIDIGGEETKIQITLSEFTQEQTSVFIDRVATYWRSEGYSIPDPEDIETVKMFNYYKEKGLI